IFEQMAETIAWERWEGTIEYTFMAPVPRVTHLLGMCGATLVRALGFSVAILAAVAFFVPVDLSHANPLAAIVLLVVGAVAFVGLAIASAVFPLLWTEKGLQMAYIVQAVVLLVSGVYYPTTILPGWMQILSFISPATYVIRGMRDALLDGADLAAVWPNLWPALLVGGSRSRSGCAYSSGRSGMPSAPDASRGAADGRHGDKDRLRVFARDHRRCCIRCGRRHSGAPVLAARPDGLSVLVVAPGRELGHQPIHREPRWAACRSREFGARAMGGATRALRHRRRRA